MARRKQLSVCTTPGCPHLTLDGKCTEHKQAAEQQRGSAAQRGYSGKAWRTARRAVLRRDPICVVCKRAFATVADHWPDSRRKLVEQGVTNPDAPSRLRGLCAPCHGSETAREQPGGWNRRD
jgi:5-methylcytosine-specific restriction enzyme A